MTALQPTARLTLPALVIAYGILAFFAPLIAPQTTQTTDRDVALRMAIPPARAPLGLDGDYKIGLPHMGVSFGQLGAARHAALGTARSGALVGADGWLFSAQEARALPSDAHRANIVAVVQATARHLALTGTDLVVVPMPAKIDIYRDLGPDVALGQAMEILYAQFLRDLTAQGIAAVDVRQDMRNPVKPVFFANSAHWTPFGADLVAHAILRSNSVAPLNQRFDQTANSAKSGGGSPAGFGSAPPVTPRIGPAVARGLAKVPTRVAATDGPLDRVTTDMVLVGTSHRGTAEPGFADALMRAFGRDVVSVADQGPGPMAAMRGYLASTGYRTNPPAVVIWEIPMQYLTDPALWPVAADVGTGLNILRNGMSADG